MDSGELTGKEPLFDSGEIGDFDRPKLSWESPHAIIVAAVGCLPIVLIWSHSEGLKSISEQVSEPHQDGGSVEAAWDSEHVCIDGVAGN